MDVVVGSSCGKLCCGLTADWSRRAFAGPLRCHYGILTRIPPNAAHMTECAVALYEAVSRGPEENRAKTKSYLPAQLEATIEVWSRLERW